jgi:aspartate aminotransferase-like enzyme
MAMDEWGIDQRIRPPEVPGAPAGLAWQSVSRLTAIENAACQVWMVFNPLTWRHFAQTQKDWHPFPVTLPTSTLLAMREGVGELLAEGIPQRAGRYRALATRLREGLRQPGFTPLVADACAAPVVTAANSLDGIPSGQIVEYLERGMD